MSTELATIPSLTPSTMDQALSFAKQMSDAKLLPAHLRGSPSDCLRVVLQATRWQLDPFAVADKTSIISGKMMYEGQLVAAVINARGNLSSRLRYAFTGEGNNRTLVVSGTVRGETQPREIMLTHSQAVKINKNGQMQQNPDQQMCYIGARIWARREMPELMLGVYTPDELPDDNAEPINVTPSAESEPPKRTPPPKRSDKGVAAVVENASAPEEKKAEPAAVEVVATETAVTQGFAAMNKATSEALAGDLLKPSLAEGETKTFAVVKVISSEPTAKGSLWIEVEGDFKGRIFQQMGASNEIWKKDAVLSVQLEGKKSKTDGTIVPLVKTVEAANAEIF